jgi:2-keto-4-pentenoate hydratase/2-oxohepta-3-ene-1,7-dioic acid hydratase in catechol pathway
MRLVRFVAEGCAGFGVYKEDGIQPVSWEPFDYLVSTIEIVDPATATLLSPIEPSKIIAVGLNYRDHAEEFALEIPDEPLLFMKASTTVLEPDGQVIYPPQSQKIDYEAELAVVIGAEAHLVSPGNVSEYILGYTCGLDMTARDLQMKDGQWTRAKNFNTFCPLGPWVETELDPSDLEITLKLNGELRQSSRTSNLIFDVPALVSFISNIMTLHPGDVILTGTPSGVGEVKPGDTVEMSVEGIGALSCTIASPRDA